MGGSQRTRSSGASLAARRTSSASPAARRAGRGARELTPAATAGAGTREPGHRQQQRWRRATVIWAPLAAMLLVVAAAAVWAVAGGRNAAPGRPAPPPVPARWIQYRHVGTVVDLAVAPNSDTLTASAYGHLVRLGTEGALTMFARQRSGFTTGPEDESYLIFSPGGTVPGRRCSFPAGAVFVLTVQHHPGVTEVTSTGRAHQFVSLPGALPDGIAFDNIGRFGHRLLVTSAVKGRTTLFAVDCAGHATVISSHLPRVEGGITVAPRSFGRYGGDLIGADEVTGRIWALSRSGRALLVARSGLPAGQDTGVESTGFIPPGFGADWVALLADRINVEDVSQPPDLAVRHESRCVTALPDAPCEHPGTGNILQLPAAVLLRAGARPGDLVLATEARARTILVHCASTCTVRRAAAGPAVTNAEGHIVFAA